MAKYICKVFEDEKRIVVKADELDSRFDKGETVVEFDYSLKDGRIIVANPNLSEKMRECLRRNDIYLNGFYGFYFDVITAIKRLNTFENLVLGDFSLIEKEMVETVCVEATPTRK